MSTLTHSKNLKAEIISFYDLNLSKEAKATNKQARILHQLYKEITLELMNDIKGLHTDIEVERKIAEVLDNTIRSKPKIPDLFLVPLLDMKIHAIKQIYRRKRFAHLGFKKSNL